MIFVCTRCKRDVDVPGHFCPFCGAVAPPPDTSRADPLIGQTIAGKYFVNQPIGKGGMGSVYKATDLVLDRPVALKMLSKALASDPQMVQRFHREARASSKLNHPHAITVLDFGQAEDGTLYIAMEFLAGRSLSDVIQKEFPVDHARVVRIGAQILSALADAHALGIIHRDLKPSNVMVDARRDDPDFVKVLDFGIAKLNEPGDGRGRLTSVGMVCGTPGYMSPEQARGEELDARSDLYSVGVILYELVTGKLPFDDATPMAILAKQMTEHPATPRERRPDLAIPAELDALIARAMSRDRGQRFANAETFRDELLSLVLAQGAAARSTPPPGRSATVVLPAVDLSGTPPAGTARPPPQGPSPVEIDPQLYARPSGASARPSPAPIPLRVEARPATPSPKKAVSTPAPQPARAAEESEEGDDAPAEVRPKRPAPRAKAAPARPAQNRGLLYGAIGGGVLLLGGAAFFLLASDPFKVPASTEQAVPAASLALPASAPKAPVLAQAPKQEAPPVEAPPVEEAPTEHAAEAASPEDPEPAPDSEPTAAQPASVTVHAAEAPAKKGSGILQTVAGVKGLKAPPASSGEGLLSINAAPWAVLSIDGKELGETPLSFRVGAGWYRVTLTHPTLGTVQRRVVVKPGARASVNVKMAR